jgi:hypothetical protein
MILGLAANNKQQGAAAHRQLKILITRGSTLRAHNAIIIVQYLQKKKGFTNHLFLKMTEKLLLTQN